MDVLVFASRNGTRLELSPADSPYSDASRMPAWRARLIGEGVEATVVAPEAGWEPRTLVDFVADLAREWEGWDGDRQWCSQDAELRLTAARPLQNTVSLVADLQCESSWSLRAELEFDPGVLAQLAAVARQLAKYPLG